MFLLFYMIIYLFAIGDILLETIQRNPNSTITALFIGGLGIDVGWWAWNVIKMFIIVVEWCEWNTITFFMIFFFVVSVIINAVFLLLLIISILFPLPPIPPSPSCPILEMIPLIIGGFGMVVAWWAWNVTKIFMIVFFVITLLYKLFLLFLDYLPKSFPPLPTPSNPNSTITTLIIGGLGTVVGWWEWNVIKMFIMVVGWWAWSAIKMFMSFLFVVFVIIIAISLLIYIIFLLFSLDDILLATIQRNPNSTITALFIGGLGIDVGWWAWNVIQMYIIVVGWCEWNTIKCFMIFFFVVFVIAIAVLLLLLIISILFSLPPPTPSYPILTITITLIIGGFGMVVAWWAWNVTKILMIVFFVITLLYKLFLLFLDYLPKSSPPPPTQSNPNSTITTLIIGGLGIAVGWWEWNVIKMSIIVVGWWAWSAIKVLIIVFFIAFVIVACGIIAFFLLLFFLFDNYRPTTSSTQRRNKTVSSRPTPSRTSSTPTSTWSTQEGYEATAIALSLITGLNLISEKDVKQQRKLGKKVTALEIKDVFYGRLSSSNTELYYVPDSAYDPQHDHDFTNYKGDDTNCTRGGYSYKRPAGWNRKAVKVIGKYEDDVWLGQKGRRDESSPGEWAVSYYGTKIQNVPSIVVDGYDNNKCVRQTYGPGIYSTPDPKVAEDYATAFNYKGEKCKCILQNRVNLKKTNKVKTQHGIYFVTPDDDDIRPYGVCIKKI